MTWGSTAKVRRVKGFWTLVCIAGVCAMVFAAPAVAQTAAQDGYDGTGVIGQIGGDEQGGPEGGVGNGENVQNVAATTTAGQDEGGSLPFTGLDIAIVALMGGLLVATGLVLRRSARPQS
jgi:hypothetical protein